MSNQLELPNTSIRVPDRPNIERRRKGCFQVLFYPLINMSCTEQSIWVLSTLCGLFVLCAQTAPIFLLDWVHIREPRPLNLPREPSSLINEDKGPLEIPFEYNAGYFGMCRNWLENNQSLNTGNNPSNEFLPSLNELKKIIPLLAPDTCVWNSAYSGEDLSEFSFATNAILVRLLIPTIMHCSGALLTVLALLFSFLGHFGNNWKTICSAILYVCGGLIIFIGVLQVICIVDDEMAPRMKPNAAGEPSVFTFHYGFSFFTAALSFLPVQLCVWLEVIKLIKYLILNKI
ncbi:hypothetical protein Mgra_00005067 [Meloidogyne graminicola]|uniref:Uncharacterized protein n=1 Tax=Meloidogyne graminicola TaxID=189291 RepID=A0A8S9ZQG9_9BILA|nr:hypothetical protein Mgra_00005067 [Meloidogyne graminicola]